MSLIIFKRLGSTMGEYLVEQLANALSWAIFGAIAVGGLTFAFDLVEGLFDPNSGADGGVLAVIGSGAGFIGGAIYGAFFRAIKA